MTRLLAVTIGGGIGAAARYLLALAVAAVWKQPFPLPTFVVNISGCLILGIFAGWSAQRAGLHPLLTHFVVIGILGGFTTFSSMEWETSRLAGSGANLLALTYVVLSVAMGLAALQLGMVLSRRF